MGTIQQVQEPASIKHLIQGMVPEAMEILMGEVISEQPLKIRVINDEKNILNENTAVVPRHLTDYKTKVDIELDEGTLDSLTEEVTCCEPHLHRLETYNIYQATMTVYNALKAGEVVYILSYNHGKKYYILDREEEET